MGKKLALLSLFVVLASPAGAATIELSCEDVVYRVSTGTDEGECAIVEEDGLEVVQCTSAEGEIVASADCAYGCGEVTGAGECTILDPEDAEPE